MQRASLALGRIATISLRLHWSLMPIMVVLIALLGPRYAMVLAGPAAWLAATLVTILVVGMAWLHRLALVLVARRAGLHVRSITLLAYGGAAELADDTPAPLTDLLIALAGPLLSLLLAALCAGLWYMFRVSEPANETSVAALVLAAAHLAWANLVLLFLSLVPGYPADGGRLFRVTLCFLGYDRLRASCTSAQVGRLCGAAMSCGAVLLIPNGGLLLPALWLLVTGLVFYTHAHAAVQQHCYAVTLGALRVADIMRQHVRSVSPDLTLEQFARRYLTGRGDLAFPVVHYLPRSADQSAAERRPVLLGMISFQEISGHMMQDWQHRRVGTAMRPREALTVVSAKLAAAEALAIMQRERISALPVTDGPYLLAMLYRDDLLARLEKRP